MKGNIVYIAIAAILGVASGVQRFHSLHAIAISGYFFFLLLRKHLLFLPSLCAIVLFFLYTNSIERHNTTILPQDKTEFTVRFISPVMIDGDRLKAVVRTKEDEAVQLLYRLKSEQQQHELSQLAIGMVCTFRGNLEKPEPPRNFAAFNYRDYLHFQHIHWLVRPQSLSLQQCQHTPLTMYEKLLTVRQQGLRAIVDLFPPASAGIVQALIYGERTELEEDLQVGYQKLGLIHLLAISGSHVTLLVSACFYALIRFVTRETATIVLLLCLPVYMVLTGASPSVVRAVLMAMLFLILRYQKSSMVPLDILSVTCILMLALQPYALFQAGFQLSFIVSFALILSITTIAQHHSVFVRLSLTTFIAQVSALPFVLYHFFAVSLFSIPLNLLFVPLYSFLILPLSLLSVGISSLSLTVGAFFIRLLNGIIVATNELVIFLAEKDPFSFVLGRPSSVFLCCYGVAIVWAFRRMEQGKFQAFLYVALVAVWQASWPYMDKYGEVVFLDVGQGDCIYIELPYRQGVYLIDTGGAVSLPKQRWQIRTSEWDVGKQVVVPFLRAKGVRELTRLILTHGDMDHMGAATEVIQQIHVRELAIGKGAINETLAPVIAMAKKQHIAITELQKGDTWKVGNASFFVLHPAPTVSTSSDNNRSLVLYAKLGPLSWLFTGDLEKEGEQQVLSSFPHLHADVLKVGHHGSETSTSELFLQTVTPKLAVISVGKNNRYHHPHQIVLERLKAHHIPVLRTDEHGAIYYRYTKKTGTFMGMVP
ncbi:DNA internalization-related competence protein ComEC/Rec2 [Anoxybacteroides amylolyticum]|uniref:DNA internalization-related competence protein ComEC/Rec2 n=1 Tax=Anoxybacteroides amylolyticum TaxID=294699 RepID=A0A160F4G7_9BACL|nr:DNA internalization-related competence protein ComEC/Rec2 [Anoxybacillus amylolyticus]ANB61339.1 DNA internalization-related competence protein ComEC/Rec2 [Anoxybacillus amylolyticus]